MKRPPIVAIQGGLGNQLFQWFFAHEIREDPEFLLYARFPKGQATNIVRQLGLAPLSAKCTHYRETSKTASWPFKSDFIPKTYDYLWNFGPLDRLLHFLGYFREDPRIDARAHRSPPKRMVYASGYFQHWQYAEHQKHWIGSELLPVLYSLESKLNERFDFAQPYTVIHVRRGDYRTDQNPETMIGSLADEYFIQWAKEHPSDRLILLAEHEEEVQHLISTLKPALVLDNKLTTAWETLAIMSSATTLLGSNSSLSWWGAWTASMKGATTYLPSEWDVMGRFNPSDFLFPGCNARKPTWESPSGIA